MTGSSGGAEVLMPVYRSGKGGETVKIKVRVLVENHSGGKSLEFNSPEPVIILAENVFRYNKKCEAMCNYCPKCIKAHWEVWDVEV